MKNTLLTLFILQIISVFQVFYEPLVIGSKGGPGNSSMTLMLQAYLYAFQDLEYAKAAATSVFLALIILVFTLIYFPSFYLLAPYGVPWQNVPEDRV